MLKRFLTRMVIPAASVAAIMFSPVVLTSCGDDNDDESIVPPGSYSGVRR